MLDAELRIDLTTVDDKSGYSHYRFYVDLLHHYLSVHCSFLRKL